MRTPEEIAKSKAVGLFMALQRYMPSDQERIVWVMGSMERAILSALREAAPPLEDAGEGAYPYVSRAELEAALAQGAKEAGAAEFYRKHGYDDPKLKPALEAICNAESSVGHHCQKPAGHIMDHKDRHGNQWPKDPAAQPTSVCPECLHPKHEPWGCHEQVREGIVHDAFGACDLMRKCACHAAAPAPSPSPAPEAKGTNPKENT